MDIAFLELAHRCAPGIEISLPTLAAIISVESGFAPLSIRIDGRRIEPTPKSKGEAVAVAVGFMAVNRRRTLTRDRRAILTPLAFPA